MNQNHKISDVGKQSVPVSVKQKGRINFQYLQFRDLDDWQIYNNTAVENLYFIHVTRSLT